MSFIAAFFSGVFLFNSIPHLVKGITGESHMTPFKRVSSPVLNIIWAFVNLIIGIIIINVGGGFPEGISLWIFTFGGLTLSLLAAKLFGGSNPSLPWHKK